MKRRLCVLCVLCTLLALLVLPATNRCWADVFGSGANSFEIEFVTIGSPGNAPDTTGDPNPAGAVPYEYRIGKYEISEQMIDKANALGGLGITKDTRGPNKAATSVSWFEAAQFVNWLNTSIISAPAYKFDDEGNFQLWLPGDAGFNPANPFRNTQARYFLPSADEWYKAAYYDPASGAYYDYPTGSDNIPDGLDFSGDPDFDAVFGDFGFAMDEPNDITNVGLLSPYGTAGQGGNVDEWEETDYDLVNDATMFVRGLRGGAFDIFYGALSSSLRTYDPPAIDEDDRGFRVASAIPEPRGLLLGGTAAVGLLMRRRIKPT